MKRDPLRALAVGAAVVTVALTGAAFWLSYEHLHDVAAGNGLTGARAWAWPGTVDLFIVAGELLILRAALRGRFDWFAYALAGVGSLGSIALNVAGVGADAAPMEYVVAAVPPTAALVAFGALMRQVHEALARLPEAVEAPPVPVVERVHALREDRAVPGQGKPVPVDGGAVPQVSAVGPVPWPRQLQPAPAEDSGTAAGTGSDQRTGVLENAPLSDSGTAGTGRPGAVPPDAAAPRFAEHVGTVRQWLAEDPGLTGTAIGRRLGTGDSYGRRVRRAALTAG